MPVAVLTFKITFCPEPEILITGFQLEFKIIPLLLLFQNLLLLTKNWIAGKYQWGKFRLRFRGNKVDAFLFLITDYCS